MFDRRVWSRALRLLPWVAVVVAIFWSRPASAYPWMIRHEYQGCVPCHADPSGAGLLTEYGRAMGENILRSRYGSKPPDEPPVYARFLFGVPTPDWLLLGGSVRNAFQFSKVLGTDSAGNSQPFATKFLQMEADLRAQVTFSRFRASGTLGYMHEAALPTLITHHQVNGLYQDNLSSREHWIGVDLGEDKQWLLRAGRINVPFGIRNDEHDLLVRSTQTTRTNLNESQQHGVALAYSGQMVRGELMAILGNYQINSDIYRERGYSGYVEFSLKQWAALGVSSLVTYANTDWVNNSLHHTIRQVHGVFTRLAPKEPLVIMAEVDALVTTADGMNGSATTMPGMVGLAQADVEPTQGVHLIVSGETMVQSAMGTTTQIYGAWGGVLWFFAPHADLRFDAVFSSMNTGATTSNSIYLLPQLHVYL